MDQIDRLGNAIAWVQQFRTGFRRIPLSEKVLIVEKTFSNEFSLSEIARQHGVSPNQLFWWRKLYRSASLVGMKSQGKVHTDNSVRLMEKRISELERLLGRKTQEVEILREALAMSKASKVEIGLNLKKERVEDEADS